MGLLYQSSSLQTACRVMEAGVQAALIVISIIVVVAALAFAGYVLMRNNKESRTVDHSGPGDLLLVAKDGVATAKKPDSQPAEGNAEGRTTAAIDESATIPLKISKVWIEPVTAKDGPAMTKKPDSQPAEGNAEDRTMAATAESAIISLKISKLWIEPLTAKPGEMVTIWFTATNLESSQSSQPVTLKINDRIFNVRQISILPNTLMHLNFKVMITDPGSYAVDINGTTGKFAIIQ